MSSERRIFKRLAGPFEGGWDGASGMRECRVTDLSQGGCFIDAYASNPVGARITTSRGGIALDSFRIGHQEQVERVLEPERWERVQQMLAKDFDFLFVAELSALVGLGFIRDSHSRG